METKPEPALPATEIVLKGSAGALKTRLVVPKSLGLRYEVTYAVTKSEPRAVCAALGLCSSAIQANVPWNQSVLDFGARVLEWLLEQGVPYLEAVNAGRRAWQLVSDGLVPESEVKAVEGFTVPAEEESTS